MGMAGLDDLISKYASLYGLSPATLRAFVKIESGGDPNARTGSYSGLMQLSNSEFNKYGGGDITNPEDNLRAGAAKLAAESRSFQDQYGRAPEPNDLYMMHQQGQGGYAAHMANPQGLAWENMYSTGEGREKGPQWAKQAIWGNVPSDVKERYGSVENMTSQDFVDLWKGKVEALGGEGNLAPMQTAASPAPVKTEKGEEMGGLFNMLMGGAGGMGAFGGGGSVVPSMASATDPNAMQNLFGSLASFGGGSKGGGDSADGDLATKAMTAAAGGEEAMPKMAARPFDMQKLASMLKNSGYLGTSLPKRTA